MITARRPAPFVRASGLGPTVLCLHSSGASSRQWEPLARRLAVRHRVVAADLAGHGGSAGWEAGAQPSLAEEAGRLAPLVADGGAHVVGHSYGAAVAVKLALASPGKVASLTLYEPVLVRLVLEPPARHPDGEGMVRVGGEIGRALAAGDRHEAARAFVDYWSGDGAWARLDPARRASIGERMPAVMGCFDALFGDTTTLAGIARLDVPVLLMNGTASPPSARRIAACLAGTLPRVRRHVFDHLGHMGPVTHPETVNPVIEAFLDSRAGAGRAARPAPPPLPGLSEAAFA